jgi:hypothetical protein
MAPPETGHGNIERATRWHPFRVAFEDEAITEIKRFRERCKRHKQEHRGAGLDALWARAVEHATKVALVLACGENFPARTVSGTTAAYAVKLVEHLTADLIETVRDSVAGSDFERELLYVLRVIKTSGEEGVTQTELLSRTRRLNPRQRVEILNQLVAQGGVVKAERKPARGPAAVIYRGA